MSKEEKIANLLKTAFINISTIQKTEYVESVTGDKIINELANVIGKNFNSGWITLDPGQSTYIVKHNLGFVPVATLCLKACMGVITDIDEENCYIALTSVGLGAQIKVIAN